MLTVGTEALKTALERIGIPNKLKKVIMEMRKKRTADVITKHRITQPYELKDGLDQGDPMAPLLWKIFYDPLINKLNKIEHGYKMTEIRTSNYSPIHQTEKSIKLSSLVYMDDTTWVARNRIEMNKILQIATEFYTINDIEVNTEKSKLIVINGTKKVRKEVTLNGHAIKCTEKSKAERFLGSWIQEKPGKQTQKRKIEFIINHNINILNKRKVSPEITKYLINTVILPAIKYAITDMQLTETIVRKWQSKLDNCYKFKSNLSRTYPTSALRLEVLSGIKGIEDRLIQNRLSCLEIILDEKGIMTDTMEIRLIQMQNKAWSSTKVHKNLKELGKQKKKCLLADILFHCLTQGFKIESSLWDELIKTIGGKITIEQILGTEHYTKYTKNLRQWEVIYMEQITRKQTAEILPWEEINPGKKGKRRTPQWYQQVKNAWNTQQHTTTMRNLTQGQVWNHIAMPRTNTKYDLKRVKWIAFEDKEEIVIGKKKRKINEEKARFIHYTELKDNGELVECEGCE
jgi:hypothetical protein